MSDFIRYEKTSNLFFYQDRQNEVHIKADEWTVDLESNNQYHEYFFHYKVPSRKNINSESLYDVEIATNNVGEIIKKDKEILTSCPIKFYRFKERVEISSAGEEDGFYFLSPPFGNNLFEIMVDNKQLKREIPIIFGEYKLEFLIDLEENKFFVQKKENGISYKIPYSLTADTLQRIIFHYAAIYSNKDSVILFEEPESHSFPPYVSDLAYKISQDTDNQYFITTHSPFLFSKIVEESPDEVAVFVVYFENYETKFKKLTLEDISALLNDGIDIFFNTKYFLDEPVAQSPA